MDDKAITGSLESLGERKLMSELSLEQLQADKLEKFTNDFWDSITTKEKIKILKSHYGNGFIDQEIREWFEKNKNG